MRIRLADRFQSRKLQYEGFLSYLVELDDGPRVGPFRDLGDPTDAESGMANQLPYFKVRIVSAFQPKFTACVRSGQAGAINYFQILSGHFR